MPSSRLSVSAWVAIERLQRWGGIISCLQDDGSVEKGFVLGFEGEHFSFALSTTGADDGDGLLTYFQAPASIVPGRWHHVAATYDGKVARLYVDGELESQSRAQSGELLYTSIPRSCWVPIAMRTRTFLWTAACCRPAWRATSGARARCAPNSRNMRPSSSWLPGPTWNSVSWSEPYLTWPTTEAMSVLFEMSFPSTAEVRYRRDTDPADSVQTFSSEGALNLHECRLTGLEPDQKYFYQVFAESQGKSIESPLLSFRTAASEDRAYTFVVIGDTQTNGEVAKRVSDNAWMHRPNLIVHAGDLVDTGSNKRDWTDVFFPSMQPLMGRVPIMPVLGNHEQDAQYYYDYMSLPEPERWYSFRYGNAEFFMMDGNRSLADQSAQLVWLESALSASTATWRFAILHQPPYTSDSNDYGDTWFEGAFRGDKNVRNIVKLLEKHDVDICFSGHVHDYERTFRSVTIRCKPTKTEAWSTSPPPAAAAPSKTSTRPTHGSATRRPAFITSSTSPSTGTTSSFRPSTRTGGCSTPWCSRSGSDGLRSLAPRIDPGGPASGPANPGVPVRSREPRAPLPRCPSEGRIRSRRADA